MRVGAWASALLVAWTSAGWAATDAVSPDAPDPAAAAATAPVQPVQPLAVVRPPFLVSSSSELPELMKDDSLLARRANDMVAEGHQAVAAIAIGGGAAVVLGLISAIDEQNDCFGSGVTRMCQKQPNWTILGIAGGVFAVGLLVGGLLLPHDKPVDLVNAWNQAHPDRPLGMAPPAYASDAPPPPGAP